MLKLSSTHKKVVAFVLLVLCVMLVGITNVYAVVYSGTGNFLAAGSETPWMMSEKKTSGTRYVAVNTREGYPNPGQLIGPSYLRWDVAIHPHYVVINKTIGKNTRSSSYIYEDRYVPGAYYDLSLTNTTAINATWGLTYTCNASN